MTGLGQPFIIVSTSGHFAICEPVNQTRLLLGKQTDKMPMPEFKSPTNIKHWVINILTSLSIAISVGYRGLDLWRYSIKRQALGLVVLSVVCLAIIIVLRKILVPHLQEISASIQKRLLFISIVCAILTILVVPLLPLPLAINNLEIVATGDKNINAKSNEIWIWGIQWPNQILVPWDQMTLIGAWEKRDQILLTYQNPLATLQWAGVVEKSLGITFGSHPFSGIVAIRWNGEEQHIDLFSDSDSVTSVSHQFSAAPWIQQRKLNFLLTGVLYTADLVAITYILFVVFTWLATQVYNSATTPNTRRWSWLIYAIMPIIIWSIYLTAFFPALMSADSVNQWEQAMGNIPLTDWHPLISTFFFWVSLHTVGSPAGVAIAQIIVTAMLLAYGLGLLEQIGVPRWACLASSVLAAILPINGTMVITLWKDIPYAIAILGVSVLLVQFVIHPKRSQQPAFWILLGTLGAFITLVRLNGFVVGLGIPLVMLIYTIWKLPQPPLKTANLYQRLQATSQSRQVRYGFLAGVLALLLYLFVTGPLYDLFAVERTFASQVFVKWLQTSLVPSSSTLPTGDNSTTSVNETNLPTINLNTRMQLLLRSSIVWRISRPTDSDFFPTPAITSPIEPNTIGLATTPLAPNLTPWLVEFLRYQINSDWSVLWRPAMSVYLCLLSIAIGAWRTRNPRWWLVGLPAILHSLGMLPASMIAQDVRYMYSVQLVVFILIPLMFLPRTQNLAQTIPMDNADS